MSTTLLHFQALSHRSLNVIRLVVDALLSLQNCVVDASGETLWRPLAVSLHGKVDRGEVLAKQRLIVERTVTLVNDTLSERLEGVPNLAAH